MDSSENSKNASLAKTITLPHAETAMTDVSHKTEKYWQPRSYICKRLACMQAAGFGDADYEFLMPVSGFGLSFAYHPGDKFFAHYVAPAGADDRVAKATGFGWEWLQFDNDESYWHALVETIAGGRAAQAPFLEELLFVGIRDAANPDERQVQPVDGLFIPSGTWWSWADFADWFKEQSHGYLGRHTTMIEAASPKEIAVVVMRNILLFAYDDPRRKLPFLGGVEWGLDGISAYARDIKDVSKGDDYFESGWCGCHNIYPQWTARKLTGDYLQEIQPLFGGEVADLIHKAVSEYRSAHQTWLEWETQLGHEGKAPSSAWNDHERRRTGAEAVMRALEHERNAVEIIQKAVTAL